MRVNFSFYVFYILLIKFILLQEGVVYHYVDIGGFENSLIYDCKDINLDKEIKVKISGNFIHNYIEYIFSDNSLYLSKKQYNLSELKLVYPTEYDTEIDSNGEYYDVNYYTIDKPSNELRSSQNKIYLAIVPYMDGFFDIQILNETETNGEEEQDKEEGNNKTTIIVLVSVALALFIFGGLFYYCYKKKKATQMAQSNQIYNIDNNKNNDDKNNNYNSFSFNKNVIDNNGADNNNNIVHIHDTNYNRNINSNNNANNGYE